MLSRTTWRRWRKAVHDFAERTGRKMGDVVNPVRVAVTGQGVGPGLYDCLVILGRERCRRSGSSRQVSMLAGSVWERDEHPCYI